MKKIRNFQKPVLPSEHLKSNTWASEHPSLAHTPVVTDVPVSKNPHFHVQTPHYAWADIVCTGNHPIPAFVWEFTNSIKHFLSDREAELQSFEKLEAFSEHSLLQG